MVQDVLLVEAHLIPIPQPIILLETEKMPKVDTYA